MTRERDDIERVVCREVVYGWMFMVLWALVGWRAVAGLLVWVCDGPSY